MLKIMPKVTSLVSKGCFYVDVPITKTIAHQPGSHPNHCPLIKDCIAVEVRTEIGSRWFGTDEAFIGSDLRFHINVNPKDEVLAKWEDSDYAI